MKQFVETMSDREQHSRPLWDVDAYHALDGVLGAASPAFFEELERTASMYTVEHGLNNLDGHVRLIEQNGDFAIVINPITEDHASPDCGSLAFRFLYLSKDMLKDKGVEAGIYIGNDEGMFSEDGEQHMYLLASLPETDQPIVIDPAQNRLRLLEQSAYRPYAHVAMRSLIERGGNDLLRSFEMCGYYQLDPARYYPLGLAPWGGFTTATFYKELQQLPNIAIATTVSGGESYRFMAGELGDSEQVTQLGNSESSDDRRLPFVSDLPETTLSELRYLDILAQVAVDSLITNTEHI